MAQPARTPRNRAASTLRSTGGGRTRAGSEVPGDVQALVDAVDAAQRAFREVVDEARSELGDGLTATQFRLLHRLRSLGQSRLIDLAAVLGIAPSTATRICDVLADRNLIVRHRQGRDRRELQIEVTPAGIRLLEAIGTRTGAGWKQRLGRLRPEERRSLTEALKLLTTTSPGQGGRVMGDTSSAATA